MSTQTTNVFQQPKVRTFSSNVFAGVTASVMVLFGQSLVEGFKFYLKDNGNILQNSGFIWILVLVILPLAGIWWGINDAKKPTSGRSNKSIWMFIGAMTALILALVFMGYAMMALQALVNSQNA